MNASKNLEAKKRTRKLNPDFFQKWMTKRTLGLASCHYGMRAVEWCQMNKVVLVPREANPPNCSEVCAIERYWALESESVDHECVGHGVDCLGGRPHQPAGPFHYLINEQAKSLVALQELQNEVGALLEFRDLVMETFPNLRSKLHQQNSANSTPATMTGKTIASHSHDTVTYHEIWSSYFRTPCSSLQHSNIHPAGRLDARHSSEEKIGHFQWQGEEEWKRVSGRILNFSRPGLGVQYGGFE
ncbi:hypothetical protein YQE_03874, partial [Dendroctonus ponderosae]